MNINSTIRKVIFTTIFVLPFFFLRDSLYPLIFPKSLFFEAMTLILATLWVIYILFKKEQGPISKSRDMVFLVFLVYVLAFLVSGLNGFVPSLSFWGSIDHGTGVIFMLCLFVFSFITSLTFQKIEDWYKVFSVFVLSGIFFTIGTFLSETTNIFLKTIDVSSASGFLIGNSSWTGVYLVFVFFIALGLVFVSKTRIQKIIGILGVLTAFFNPTLTGFIQTSGISLKFIGLAQAGSYSLLVGIGLFIIYLFFRKISSSRWRKIFVGSFIAIFLVGVFVSFTQFGHIYQWVSEKAGANRFVFWDISISGFKERPLLGWGGDSYQYVYAKYFNPIVVDTPGYATEFWVDRAHNIYFDELVSGGIVGFFLLMSLYGIILFGLIKRAVVDRGKEGIFFMALFAGMVSFLIQGLMFFQINIGWVVVAMMIAFVANFCFKNKDAIVVVDKNKIKNKDKNYSLISVGMLLVAVIFVILFNYMIVKPYKVSNGLVKFSTMRYYPRMEFFKELDNAYVGNTTDLGNIFIPYYIKLMRVVRKGLNDEEKKLMVKEIVEINRVLDNSLKRQHFQDVKILTAMNGFYSIAIALTSGQERQMYYDQGMSYIQKMHVVSPRNPIAGIAKALLDVSLKRGESSFDDILNSMDKKDIK